MVAGILRESALDPACHDLELELELTESLIMHDVEKALITLNRLHEMGSSCRSTTSAPAIRA